MDTIYPSNAIPPIRQALIDFARRVDPTHLVTFNFHEQYTPEYAERRIRKWYIDVLRRLFRCRPGQKRSSGEFQFIGFPEYSLAGHIHYHTVMRVRPSHVNYFLRIATQARWKRIVPTGTFDVRPIGNAASDLNNILTYITKRPSAERVLHSAMFKEPN